MTRFLQTVLLLALMAGLLVAAGCGDKNQNSPPTTANEETPPPKIRQIMRKMNQGKQALLPSVGRELAADEPPWDEITGQVKEVVQLSDELGKYDPPKGDKDSWLQETKVFTDKAAELERAVQARDRDKAKAAHKKLEESCNSCHKAHRP
jgi:hypothetical protein